MKKANMDAAVLGLMGDFFFSFIFFMSVCVWGLWVIGQCRAFVCIIIKRERERAKERARERGEESTRSSFTRSMSNDSVTGCTKNYQEYPFLRLRKRESERVLSARSNYKQFHQRHVK